MLTAKRVLSVRSSGGLLLSTCAGESSSRCSAHTGPVGFHLTGPPYNFSLAFGSYREHNSGSGCQRPQCGGSAPRVAREVYSAPSPVSTPAARARSHA